SRRHHRVQILASHQAQVVFRTACISFRPLAAALLDDGLGILQMLLVDVANRRDLDPRHVQKNFDQAGTATPYADQADSYRLLRAQKSLRDAGRSRQFQEVAALEMIWHLISSDYAIIPADYTKQFRHDHLTPVREIRSAHLRRARFTP